MSSSNLKRSGKAPKPSDGHRESVPSEVANSGLMETNGDQLFLKAPTNQARRSAAEGVKAPSTEQSFAWHEAVRES